MKKILISYADENMAYSLKRLGREAEKLNIFDVIRLYTPSDLPTYLRESPLMKYERGGGYWAWKPVLIWETLQEFGDDSIVLYLDAGCSVNISDEWIRYFDRLETYDTICFEYKDNMPDWEQFGQTSTLIKYWTKDSTANYFKRLLNDDYLDKFNKIWGGAMFFKSSKNQFVKTWLDITLCNPELVIDPDEEELNVGNKNLAFHKHDQAIITPLAHYFKDSVLILTETAETQTDGPIVASRIRTKTYFDYVKLISKNKLRSLLGGDIYNSVKKMMLGR